MFIAIKSGPLGNNKDSDDNKWNCETDAIKLWRTIAVCQYLTEAACKSTWIEFDGWWVYFPTLKLCHILIISCVEGFIFNDMLISKQVNDWQFIHNENVLVHNLYLDLCVTCLLHSLISLLVADISIQCMLQMASILQDNADYFSYILLSILASTYTGRNDYGIAVTIKPFFFKYRMFFHWRLAPFEVNTNSGNITSWLMRGINAEILNVWM